jgi:hypothetical protein
VARPTSIEPKTGFAVTFNNEVRPRDVRGALSGPRMRLRSEQEREVCLQLIALRAAESEVAKGEALKKETRPDSPPSQTCKLHPTRTPLWPH